MSLEILRRMLLEILVNLEEVAVKMFQICHIPTLVYIMMIRCLKLIVNKRLALPSQASLGQ